MPGKLRPELLRTLVFSRIGVRDPRVLVGPRYGEDAAVIDMGNEVLVIHSDPITAAVDLIGWLSVHIASNDIAVCGAKPRWLLPVILLPEVDNSLEILDRITEQMHKAATEIGAQIVGGHTEVTPELSRPIVSMTAIGIAPRSRFVTTSGARPGDVVLMTKSAGLEGTAIIATDFENELLKRGVAREIIDSAKRFYTMVSVVKEALLLAELGATAMHDPTEGGILGGLAEIAYASRVKIVVWENRIPIAFETQIICNTLGLDPLKLISSGVLLATLPRERAESTIEKLKELGIEVKIIGEVVEGLGVELHRASGAVEHVGEYVEEEIYKLWS